MKLARVNYRLTFALLLLLAGVWRQIAKEHRSPILRAGLRYYAYVGNVGDGTVTAVDLVNLRAVATIPVGPTPSGLRAHPLRDEIWGVSTSGGYAWVIDTHQGQIAARIPIGQGAFALDFSADGKIAYVASSVAGTVAAIDCAQRHVLATAHLGRQPWVARPTTDGTMVAVTLRGAGRLALLDAHTLAERHSIAVAPNPEQLFLTADEPKAFISAAGSQQVSVVDLRRKRLLTNLPLGAPATDFVFNPKGELYAITPAAHGITVLDTWRNEVGDTRILGGSPTQGTYAVNGDLLFVADSTAHQIRPLLAEFRQPLRPIPAGQRPVTTRFTDDESLFLVVNEASEDLTVMSRVSQALALRQTPPFTMIPLGRQPRDLAIKLF
jgi:YVTN family beta-propeller protein